MKIASSFMEVILVGKKENIAEEVDMDCRGVVEVIAKEVDDEKAKEKQQQKLAAAGWPVDWAGRPPAVAGARSTGPVDRRAQHAQRHERSTARSTAGGARSTARSTD